MGADAWDWVNLLLRWGHVMLGIAWIGTSFHFIWLDASLRREEGQAEGVSGGSWMVHGGGSSRAQVHGGAGILPEGAALVQIRGLFHLGQRLPALAVVYYLGASEFLIDPAVLALSPPPPSPSAWEAWRRAGSATTPSAALRSVKDRAAGAGRLHPRRGRGLCLRPGLQRARRLPPCRRAAGHHHERQCLLHHHPNQKKVVADLIAGRTPTRPWASRPSSAVHNNYLTLPVVLMMLSNHYPMLYARADNWVYVAGVLVLGAGAPLHQFRDHGVTAWWLDWVLPAARPGRGHDRQHHEFLEPLAAGRCAARHDG
jgi:hypothetical protein